MKENVRAHISAVIGKKELPCASVLVYQENQGFYREEFGFSDISKNEALTKDAMFRLASMTKPITAVAVLMQAQRGKLKIEDPVSQYLPAYEKLVVGPERAPCQEPLRVWHLLTR